MFSYSTYNQPLGAWDVSGVTDMESMFHGSDVFNRPLTNWRGSSLTNMKSMFQNATKFNQPLSELDVASVLYMQDMFNGATSFDQSPFCETSWVKSTADKTSMFIGVHQGKICCGPGNYSTGDTTCTNCPTGMYMDEASVLPCKYHVHGNSCC